MRPGGNAIREGSNNVSLEACLCVSGFSMQEVPVGFNKSLESKEAISTRASLVAVLLAGQTAVSGRDTSSLYLHLTPPKVALKFNLRQVCSAALHCPNPVLQ